MFIEFKERGKGRERNIHKLPLLCALTRDKTQNLFGEQMTRQPAEAPGRAEGIFKRSHFIEAFSYFLKLRIALLSYIHAFS